MPLSKAGKNAIQAYGMKRFQYTPPATSTQEATTQPFYNQSQTQSGPEQSAGSAPSGIRNRLLQTINPEPVRDVNEEERLKKLAKVNALGTALGSLGQLAGVASGGDAVEIRNNVNPFIMDRMTYLDDDYRNQLQQYNTRAFAMDQFNVRQQNDDIQDQNTNAYQQEQIRLRGEEARQTAKERLKAELHNFFNKKQSDREDDMRKVGIDPRLPDSEDRFIERMNQKYGIDTNYRKSFTTENYADANRTNNPLPKAGEKEFDLETMKKGVGTIVADLEKQRAQIEKLPFQEREAARKKLDDEITFWKRQYNPKTNELLNEQVLDAAGRETNSQSGGQGGFGQPYTPGQGFNMNQQQPEQQSQAAPAQRSEEEVIQAMNVNRKAVIANAKRIAAINLEDPDPETANLILEKAQELVDLGVFEDQDSAIESILNLAKSNAK